MIRGLRYLQITALSAVSIILAAGLAFCAPDGFVPAREIPGEHFHILCQSEVDILALSDQLNIGATDRLLAGKSPQGKLTMEQELSEMLDTLFIRVCNILDMRLYNDFSGMIKVCRDNNELSQVYFNLFNERPKANFPFYIHQLNTIYASADNFTSSVIGHEIAHAVISHYFVVLPSVKMQEILAGYVEYQLRKDFDITAPFKWKSSTK